MTDPNRESWLRHLAARTDLTADEAMELFGGLTGSDLDVVIAEDERLLAEAMFRADMARGFIDEMTARGAETAGDLPTAVYEAVIDRAAQKHGISPQAAREIIERGFEPAPATHPTQRSTT